MFLCVTNYLAVNLTIKQENIDDVFFRGCWGNIFVWMILLLLLESEVEHDLTWPHIGLGSKEIKLIEHPATFFFRHLPFAICHFVSGRLFSFNLLTLSSNFCLNTTPCLAFCPTRENVILILSQTCACISVLSVPGCSAASAASLFQYLLQPTLGQPCLHYFTVSVKLPSFLLICFVFLCLC